MSIPYPFRKFLILEEVRHLASDRLGRVVGHGLNREGTLLYLVLYPDETESALCLEQELRSAKILLSEDES